MVDVEVVVRKVHNAHCREGVLRGGGGGYESRGLWWDGEVLAQGNERRTPLVSGYELCSLNPLPVTRDPQLPYLRTYWRTHALTDPSPLTPPGQLVSRRSSSRFSSSLYHPLVATLFSNL